MTLQYANVMGNSVDVFSGSYAAVRAAAEEAGRESFDPYTIWSICVCVLEEGESPASERALEQAGPGAMMAFHAYADHPRSARTCPRTCRSASTSTSARSWPASTSRATASTRRPTAATCRSPKGEDKVLTEEIMRGACCMGTAQKIADVLNGLRRRPAQRVLLGAAPPHA